MIKENMTHLILTQKKKKLLMKAALMMYFINLYYNFIKHTQIFRKRFRLNY